MRITVVEPLRRRAQRVSLQLDDGMRVEVAVEVFARSGLRVGSEVTHAELAALERRDTACRARDSALRLLSRRARSAAELRRRLARKGFSAEVAEACLAELEERGYVDDAAFASAWVRDRFRFRPRGRRGLHAELRARGVDAVIAAAAIDEVLGGDGDAEAEMARAVAAKWHPRRGEDPLRARRRLERFLARRGFAADAIRAAAAARLAEVADGD